MGKKPPPKQNSGNEELHGAARSGNLKAVMEILSSNPLAVNSRDRHSRTPYPFLLHLAAWSGHADIVNYLSKNKADVGAAAMDDMGAIHFAAQKGHLEVIKILLASGVSVKSSNRKGMTALHYAAQGSNLELVKYLVRRGSNTNAKNKAGKTAVDLASSEEIRKCLLEPKSMAEKTIPGVDEKSEPTSSSQKEMEVPDGSNVGDEKDETLKRKGEDEIEENQTGSKKSKVALNHLITADDMLEEEGDEENQ